MDCPFNETPTRLFVPLLQKTCVAGEAFCLQLIGDLTDQLLTVAFGYLCKRSFKGILASLSHFYQIMGKFWELLKDNRVMGSEPKVLTLLV